MKTIFSEEELSVMEALEVKGGSRSMDHNYTCTVIQNCRSSLKAL